MVADNSRLEDSGRLDGKQCMSQRLPYTRVLSSAQMRGDRRRTGAAPQEKARAARHSKGRGRGEAAHESGLQGSRFLAPVNCALAQPPMNDASNHATDATRPRAAVTTKYGAGGISRMTEIRRRKMQWSRRITGTAFLSLALRDVATAAPVTAHSFRPGEPLRHDLQRVTYLRRPRTLRENERNTRLSSRKTQVSNRLHEGGAVQSLPRAWSGSIKCSDHQCPLPTISPARPSCSPPVGVRTDTA